MAAGRPGAAQRALAAALLFLCFLPGRSSLRAQYDTHDVYFVANSRVFPRALSPSAGGKLPAVMVATIVRDSSSWSDNRTLDSYMDLIAGFQYPAVKISIALLVSDRPYFDALQPALAEAIRRRGFRQATLIYRSIPLDIPYEHRHEFKYQRERRRTLARLRNLLLFSALRAEQGVLWLDADVTRVPPRLLEAAASSGKDIVAARCMMANLESEYDYNTWQGSRVKPTAEQRQGLARGELFVPRPERVKYLKEAGQQGQRWVRLASVGATFLYVRAVVHREGAAFTTSYVVGSEWEHEGYDGIESEGLCYTARFLGYQCWGIADEFTVHAANFAS
jgi:mannan polymerase complexes MNN9 subunit